MITLLGLVVLMAAFSHGLDSICDATQDAVCNGTLGLPVYLQLMRDATGYELKLLSGDKIVFKSKYSKTVFSNEFNTSSYLQRWQFVPDNGTLIINPAERSDAGTYRVDIYEESTGKSVGKHTVQLIIEAPVSDVDLSISCSANGEREVRCSSKGDSPQYSWSLDGRPLSKADADLSADPQTLLLSVNVTGELTCSVSNHISSKNTSTLLLDACSGTSTVSVPPTNQTNTTLPSTHPGTSVMVIVICVLLSLTVCLCVAVGMFYIRMKKRNTHTPVSEKKEPDDLVYVQVTTGSNGRRQISDIQGTRVETEDVVYSGVAMANRSSRHKSRKPPAAEAYELEYAEVSVFSKRRGPTESHRPEESVEYGEVRVHTSH